MTSTIRFLGSNPLLASAVLILNAISVYTTKIGFALIWKEGNDTIAWGFALAIGLMMTHLTFKVAEFQGEVIWRLVAGYGILAAVSIFFNFNAIFSRIAAADLERSTYVSLTAVHDRLLAEAKSHVEKKFEILELRTANAEALAGMEYEKERPDIPGTGSNYRAYLLQQKRLTEKLQVRESEYKKAVEELESIADSASIDAGASSYEQIHNASSRKRTAINRMVSLLAGKYGLAPTLSPEEKSLIDAGERKTDLWFSAAMIAEEIRLSTQGDYRRPAFFKFLIALLISVLIDVPVFVVIAGSSSRRPSAATTPQEPPVFEDNESMWRSSQNASAEATGPQDRRSELYEEPSEMWDRESQG